MVFLGKSVSHSKVFYRRSLGLPVGTAGATEQKTGEPVLGLSLGAGIVQGWHRVPQCPHMWPVKDASWQPAGLPRSPSHLGSFLLCNHMGERRPGQLGTGVGFGASSLQVKEQKGSPLFCVGCCLNLSA